MDKYDQQIAELTENPEKILNHWMQPKGLFAYANDGKGYVNNTGCLTMIRYSSAYNAQTENLTNAIRNDIRIPKDQMQITVDHLPVFAEWQRLLDKEFNRT